MNTKNVTVTSKNQITLPSDYVKTLQLTQSRVLRANLQKGKIVLTPQPSLGNAMKPYWGRHSVRRPLTEDEIKKAVRITSAEKAAKAE